LLFHKVYPPWKPSPASAPFRAAEAGLHLSYEWL